MKLSWSPSVRAARLLRPLPFLPAIALALALSQSQAAFAEKAAPLSALGKMPVKEITVFKDGHAFVAREGVMPTDAAGNVLMDDLPAPVLGTFWPYAADPNTKLTGTVASRRRVLVERTALSLRELLAANVGAEGYVTEDVTNHYAATIMGIPERSSEELAQTSPPNSGEKLPEKSNIILLQTRDGLKAVNIDRIQDITFKDSHKPAATQEEFRNLLTLKLDWTKGRSAKTANVGLLYLQKGVRWIPNYKVSLDGKGQATIKLQATLINELTDLEDANVNLVIGVPTFYFKDTLDPMALQQVGAQLSSFFQNDPSGNFWNGSIANNFSNAIMTQQARVSDYRRSGSEAGTAAAVDLGPEIADSKKSEDLYVFNVKHVTLKKGERMVLPVAEFTLPYQDVFTLELPFGPPRELRNNNNLDQQRELARLLNAPRVSHKIRLRNNSKFPLTTAPALILSGDRVLAQGLMTYASPGAQSDVTIGTAIDVSAKKSDVESKRMPNALTFDREQFTLVSLNGKITLTNHRAQPVDLEVTRYVLGSADSAGHDGKIEKINASEEGEEGMAGDQPYWQSWYGWPSWWHALNGVGRITWKLNLESGASADLDYTWSYYWR
ncbi:MAG: hypothetical protein JWR19_4343 [Pedosphaera sp.]|nr:hypothetical protein [Pedosphaera sp.]